MFPCFQDMNKLAVSYLHYEMLEIKYDNLKAISSLLSIVAIKHNLL